VPITAVVTEMRFDTSSATPKLTFKPVRVLEPQEHEAAITQGKSPAALRAITMTVAEADGVKVPEVEFETMKPKAEVVEAVVEEEPVKRVAKKEEAPTEKKDLSKILDEWDD